MIKISEISDFPSNINIAHGAVLYFAINKEDLERPFVFGAHSHPSLGGHASWGSSSSFGLNNLNDIKGLEWRDWRASLEKLNCAWVVSIIEEAQITGNTEAAVLKILNIYENNEN